MSATVVLIDGNRGERDFYRCDLKEHGWEVEVDEHEHDVCGGTTRVGVSEMARRVFPVARTILTHQGIQCSASKS